MRWLMNPGAPGAISLKDFADRPPWLLNAVCRGEPIETFFPPRGSSYERARELCSSCPARPECLSYALADPELVGFWAGTTEKQRKKMRRIAG